MGRKPKSRPSFFKVMVKDFTSHIQLPPAFVRKYGEIIAENTKLRTSSGEAWNVELEKIDDENYYFTRGWNKFAKDVGVKLGEFLVFWFDIGKSTFDVSVCGTNGCGRQISARIYRVEGSEPEVKNKKSRAYFVKNEAAGSDGTQEHDQTSVEVRPLFELLLKEHHRWRVFLRKDFVQAAGLVDQKAVVLEYQHKQRYWPVLLANKPHTCMHEMAIGWSEFRKENGLVMGKSYSFEFNSTKNVIQVKESTNSLNSIRPRM